MLAMCNRQARAGAGAESRASRRTGALLFLVLWTLTACLPPPDAVALTAAPSSPATFFPTLPPAPAPPASPTPLPAPTIPAQPACADQSGRVEQGSLETGGLLPVPLRYRVYLPPCYAPDLQRYPLLILFHGQGYDEDQWLRLGADRVADRLALEGRPFLVLLPYDPYARQASDFPLDRAVTEVLLPFVERAYAVRAEREARAVGGLSRGAGWAVRLGLTRPDLFGALGAHSPAILADDGPLLDNWLAALPPDLPLRITLDSSENDPHLPQARTFEQMLTDAGLPHEWHLYTGYHDERYWSAHVEEYLRWYAAGW